MAAKKKTLKRARPVVPGDPAKDVALKEAMAVFKKLTAAKEVKNYDLATLKQLKRLALEVYGRADDYVIIRLEQATKGPNR